MEAGGSDGSGGESRPVVLALVGFYPPAYRAGGPARSVPGIVEHLAGTHRFKVVTRDRDLGVAAPFGSVPSDRWTDCGAASCLYLSPTELRRGGTVAAIRRTPHDVLYLNSVFAVQFSLAPLLLRRLRLLPRRGLVLAARGELDPAALRLKGLRKRAVLWAMRRLGLTRDAVWHAATEQEASAIRREFPSADVRIAQDIPIAPGPDSSPRGKVPGELRAGFLGRVSRMKNLDFAIRALAGVKASVEFDVHGPIEDAAYWAECQRLVGALPANVSLTYRGAAEPDSIPALLSHYHLLVLPSRGESFGHAIVEALMAGCPVLISDATPWRDLEAQRAGWDLPLDDPARFAAAIDRCAAMDQAEFQAWSAGARRLGLSIAGDPAVDDAYRAIFAVALNRIAATSGRNRS